MGMTFGWKGAVDTDLSFADFYGADHTIAVWFLLQYPLAYAGPILSVNGTGSYLVGQGDRNTQSGPHLISRIEDGSGVHLPTALDAGVWNLLAVVRQGNTVQLFLNGNVLGPSLTLSNKNTPAGTLRLGRPSPGAGVDGQEAQFYGILDDLAVYTRALSSSELQAQFANRGHLTGNEPDLLAGWIFSPTPSPGLPPRMRRAVVRSGQTALVPTENPRCPALREETANAKAEILDLQAELQTASPGEKPGIANKIKTWQAKLAALEHTATSLGCNPLEVAGADARLIPLPEHPPMELPFLSGEPWLCSQGFANPFSHRGYAAFCWDFVKADVGDSWTDVYPNSSFKAPIYSVGAGGVVVVDDTRPPYPVPPDNRTNMISVRRADGFLCTYLHLLKNSGKPYEGQNIYNGQPAAQICEEWTDPNRPAPHLHFAIEPDPSEEIGRVTAPSAFSNYEVRNPDGSWTFVPKGIPINGQVVRRTGPRLWLVEAAAASYQLFLVPTIGFRLISQWRPRARMTIEVSVNGGPFLILRSEDPYNGTIPASLVGSWRSRLVPANTRSSIVLFWLGKTEGATTFFNVNGRFRFRLTATDEDGLSAEPVMVETLIRWHGERVTCVRLQGPPKSRRIIAIGGPDSDRGAWTLATKDAIAALERGERLYVQNRAGQRANLYVVDRDDGRQFLSTVPDAVQTNNLLKLPRCP